MRTRHVSSRAPNRNDVNKVAAATQKGKVTAEWVELVLEYARYLGMDPAADKEFLWIAVEAMSAVSE